MTDPEPRRAPALAVLLAVAAALAVLLAAGGPAVAGAQLESVPSATCGDANDTGVLYETDAGFAAIDDAPSPPPENGTVRNATTVRMGNLTLRADGNASVRVEDATGTPCLAAVNATVPIRVAVDGGPTATVEGTASRLALGPVAVGDGTADLAYAADAGLDLTVHRTGLARGTTVEATDGSGAILTTATAGANGRLALGLPAATANVSLAVVDEGTATDTGTPPGTGTPTDATPSPGDRRTTVGATVDGTPTTPASSPGTPTNPEGSATDDGTGGTASGTATTGSTTGTAISATGTTAPTTTAPPTATTLPENPGADGDSPQGTATEAGTTGGDGPGMGALAALLALAVAVALLRRK